MRLVSAHRRVVPHDAAWIEGAYTLTINTDDVANTCDFHIPDDLPQPGSTSTLHCDHVLMVSITQDARCRTVMAADAISNTCDPINGRFTLQAALRGKPSSIAARLERDGTVLLDEHSTPSYQTNRPNGPDCEPVCEGAQVELKFL